MTSYTKPTSQNREDEEAVDQIKPYYHYEQLATKRIQHFYISSQLSDPDLYVDMIHKIQIAGPDDVVYIHLNTPGGQLGTGIQIINAMQSTLAKVIVGLESEAHSLGTLIFLAADEFVVHDNCIMMFHNFSSGTYGKGHEQLAALDATVKWYNDMAKKYLIPFISEEEFARIERGEDIYFHSDEIRKRLEKMVKLLEKEQKARETKKPPVRKKRAAKKRT